MLSNANENWYIILYDLFSRLWYITTCGPFCKDATHINNMTYNNIRYMQCMDTKYTKSLGNSFIGLKLSTIFRQVTCLDKLDL